MIAQMSQARTLRQILVAVTCVLAAEAATRQPAGSAAFQAALTRSRQDAGATLDVPFFPQQKNGCGAASVAMVVHYWRSRLAQPPAAAPSAEQVYQRLYDADRRGILLADMKSYLEELGFRAFTLRGQWADVEQHLAKGRPIIVALRKERTTGMHFAVVIGAEGNHVWLNDPTRKKASRVQQAAFQKQWEMADRWMLLAAPALTEPRPAAAGSGQRAP